MKQKKYLNFLVLGIFLVFSLGFISSANTITLDAPAADAMIDGTYSVNSSLDTNSLNITYVTFYYKIGTGSWVTIGSTTNTTVAQLPFNKTFDTTSIVDDNDLTFNATAYNETSAVTSDTSTGVDINNGVPTATISSATFTDNLALVTGTTFVFGIDADATIGIDSCIAYFTNTVSSAVISQAVTPVSNACSLSTTPTTQTLSINQAYNVLMEAVDGNTNRTNSSSRKLIVTPASAGGSGQEGVVDQEQDTREPSEIGKIGFFQAIGDFFRNLWDKIIFWKK